MGPRRKSAWVFACLLLACSSVANCEEVPSSEVPSAIQSEPSRPADPTSIVLPVGQFAALSAPSSESTVGYSWVVHPQPVQFVIADDGKRAFVASGTTAATYVVVLAVASDGTPTQHVWIISVDGQPGPGPGPNPDLPPALAGLALVSHDHATLVDVDARGHAKALAAVYRSIAKRVQAGELEPIDAAVAALRDESREALGEHRDAWVSWAGAIKTELDRLYDADKLPDLASHAKAFSDIAAGLEAVR